MASLNPVGLVGMIELGRMSELPIHAHRNGWGYLSRHPLLGWSYIAWQKIWRLAGADHMHVNGIANKFCEADESVIASARACLAPLLPDLPATVMPVFSSGRRRRRRCRHGRLSVRPISSCCRRRHHGPSGGPAAGVRALREAWDAAMATGRPG
ncbi:MAG: RuBisCO large subunit C-terminal-like domain-containing protein [Geminicoccaceae bacterium]